MSEEDKIPFTDHLEELRKRLIICFAAIGAGFVISYGFKEKLFQILTRPLITVMQTGDNLIFTGLPEAFFTYLKVAFIAGMMLAAPVIIYQFWIFVAPGLYNEEKRLLIPVVVLSSFFFYRRCFVWIFYRFPIRLKVFFGICHRNYPAASIHA